MILRSYRKALLCILVGLGLFGRGQAESVAAAGGAVTYSGAASARTLPDGDVVLVFTNTLEAGTFTLPKNAKARVLSVGGGGAGGAMALVDEFGYGKGAGGGGGAGGVSDRETILDPGTYTVQVGRGGQRVQTIVQSWVGENGQNTVLMRGDRTLSAGKGGGGGGAVKVNGHGEPGGSGGGGSWFGDFTEGGTAVDGQGWAGGKPEDFACGGGGGGAAKTAADGMGRADGTPGAGRSIDITGETVVYGRGGRGGRRDDAWEPMDGTGFGDGGDGAGASGRGGAGAPGVFVIRIHKLFDYTKVDYPAGASFVWEDGKEFVAFDADKAPEPLKSAIDYVEGTTRVACSLGTDESGNVVSNGLGRTFYAIHLKDEFVWNDGSADGSAEPFVAYWRVKEPGTVGESTIEVTKTVNWSEGDKATIAINIKTTPEKREEVPNVLVLGSLCDAHDLTAEIVRTTLNTITEVGNVDYYYFNASTATASLKGSLSKGQKYSGTVTVKTSNHWTADAFYTQIWSLISAGTAKKYDYVLFSFDRSRVVGKYTSANAHEKDVADFLKPYYEKSAVIWLVDNLPADCTYSSGRYTIPQTPWYPCDLYPYTSGDTTTWRTFTKHLGSSAYTAFKGLIGLFAPVDYDRLTQTFWNSNNLGSDLGATSSANVKKLAGATNPNQCVYDNAANVAQLIANVVVAKPSTIAMADTVYVESGLKLDPELTRGQWTTNEARMGWRDLTAEEFQITEKGVKLTLPGINDPAEIRLFVGVEDTGAFRSSVGATFNERTGQWEKDPNNGPVTVSVKPDGSEAVLARAQATTAVAWSFPTYTIKGTVVHGEGEVVLNGFVVDSVSVAEGTTPEIVFRGKGGWVVDYLEVDGREIKDFDKDLYYWYFENVGADHELKVGFKSVLEVPYPTTTPRVETYDGTPYGPGITAPTFIDGYYYDWMPVYSLTPDGTFTPTGGVTHVVYDDKGNPSPQTVYVRVLVMQPGYEEGVVIDTWTGVNTVTILPRPLTVKFDNYVQTGNDRKSTGFTYSYNELDLVEGDVLLPPSGEDGTGLCTDFPAKNGKTVGSIRGATEDILEYTYDITTNRTGSIFTGYRYTYVTNSVTTNVLSSAFRVETPEHDGSNYALTVLPGDYAWEAIIANAQNVVKYYDGKAAGITVNVDYPTVSGGATVTYNTTGGSTYGSTKGSWTDVGVYTNYYQVKGNKKTSGSNKYDYSGLEVFKGYATVTILPRPVTVRAESAEKLYDATPLTAGYTVDPATETTGFVGTEGFSAVRMTAASTITDPGSVPNVVDRDRSPLKTNTKASNYVFTYLDGRLLVHPNPITATANPVVKVYDGTPADPIVVAPTFTNGTAFTQGKISYKTSLDGDWTSTLPPPPTDAGQYPVWYQVDGDGYGTVEGVTTYTITPRAVTLQAATAEKTYDGAPLTDRGFSVVPGGAGEATGFVGAEGVSAVTMTAASTITNPGRVQNEINVYDTEHWTMNKGTKVQNYTFTVLPGTLTVRRRTQYEVQGDGEFRWTDPAGAKPGSIVTVVVDGKVTSQVYEVGVGATNHVIHVTDEPGADGATHVVEFLYSDPYELSIFVEHDDWTPAATRDDLYSLVTTDPPPVSAEELQKNVVITNGPMSGWMPLTDDTGTVVGVRSPDGTEGVTAADDLASHFDLTVVGTGEIQIDRITIPVKGDPARNPDGGRLTITVDDTVFVIPPVPVDTVSYTVSTNGDTIVIENLVIKVSGDSDTPHRVAFDYARDADDPSGNTAATVEGITWKTYGESDDGGTSWLQGKALWIIDHENDTEKRLVYLAFEPELKVEEELEAWVRRSSENGKIKVKYGKTREAADAATPVTARLSAVHPVKPVKVWIQVSYDDLDTIVEPVGYWRIYIDGSAIKLSGTGGGSNPGLQTAPGPGLQDAKPIVGEGAVSVNTFGILKIESATANTLIAVPWTWYSKAERDARDIPVSKLVKTTNLDEDDLLLAWQGDGTYAAWAIDDGEWAPLETVKVEESATGAAASGLSIRDPKAAGGVLSIVSDKGKTLLEQISVPRGRGLWLCRKNPLNADGTPKPFWVYGQSVTTEVETEIPAPEGEATVTSTMLGNPYAQETSINELVFDGEINVNDHIWVPNGTLSAQYLVYKDFGAQGKKWCYARVKKVGMFPVTEYVTDIRVPAGLGFWYDRRGKTPLTIRWPKNEKAAAE